MTAGQTHSIDVFAGAVDYLSFGDDGAAETVVLLHASATGAAALSGLATQLSPGRRVLVPNLDGYGETKLDCAKCPATFRHIQAVERFLAALSVDNFHLVGHSMGGLIALRIARRARFRLKSLALVEPMVFGVLDEERDAAALAFDREMIRDFLAAVEEGALERGLALFTERVGGQKWSELSERAQVELLALIPQIAEEAPLVSCDDLTADDFAAIGVPTLLLKTELGPPPAGPILDRLSAAMPHSRRETLADTGHMAPVAHPDAVGAAIERFYGALA